MEMGMFLTDSSILSYDGYVNNRDLQTGNLQTTILYGYYLLTHGVSFDYIFKYFFEWRYSIYPIKGHSLMRVDLGSKIGFSKTSSIDTEVGKDIACSFFIDTAINSDLMWCVTRIEFYDEVIKAYERELAICMSPQSIVYEILELVSNREIINLQQFVERRYGGWNGTFIFLMFNWVAKFKPDLLIEPINKIKKVYGDKNQLKIGVYREGDVILTTNSLTHSSVLLSNREITLFNPFDRLCSMIYLRKCTTKLYKDLYNQGKRYVIMCGKKFVINLGSSTILSLEIFSEYNNISLKGIKLVDFSNDKIGLSNLSCILGNKILCYNSDVIENACWNYLDGIITGKITEY